MNSDVLQVMAPLLGVLIGLFSQTYFEKIRQKRKRKVLKNSLKCEVRILLSLFKDERKFVGILEENLARWEKERKIANHGYPVIIHPNVQTSDFFKIFMPVYESSINEIGILDSNDAKKLLTFYTGIKYLVYEWIMFSSNDFWGKDHPIDNKIVLVKKNLLEFQETMDLGTKLIEMDD